MSHVVSFGTARAHPLDPPLPPYPVYRDERIYYREIVRHNSNPPREDERTNKFARAEVVLINCNDVFAGSLCQFYGGQKQK